jgi:hypothetical protein
VPAAHTDQTVFRHHAFFADATARPPFVLSSRGLTGRRRTLAYAELNSQVC